MRKVKPSDIKEWKSDTHWDNVQAFLKAVAEGNIGYFEYTTDLKNTQINGVIDFESAFYLNENDVGLYEKLMYKNNDIGRDTTRVYEVLLVALSDNLAWDPGFTEKFKNYIADDNNSIDMRYTAFYVLCTYFRRSVWISEYKILLQIYQGFKHDYPLSYEHLSIMLEAFEVVDLDATIKLVRRAYNLAVNNEISHNIGPGTCFADCLADALEETENNEEKMKELLETYAKYALEYLEEAINKYKQYVKFKSFRARIKAYTLRTEVSEQKREADYAGVMEDMHAAIDRETVVKKKMDYLPQLVYIQANYNNFKISKLIDERSTKLEQSISEAQIRAEELADNVKTEAEKTKLGLIETLGFFSGVIALLIADINLVAKAQSFIQAIALIIAFTGCIMISFGVFGLVIHNKKTADEEKCWYFKYLLVIGVGFVMVALSVWLGFKVPDWGTPIAGTENAVSYVFRSCGS